MRLVGLLVAITAASIVSAEAAPDPSKVVDCAAVYSAAGRFVREGARALRQMNKLDKDIDPEAIAEAFDERSRRAIEWALRAGVDDVDLLLRSKRKLDELSSRMAHDPDVILNAEQAYCDPLMDAVQLGKGH